MANFYNKNIFALWMEWQFLEMPAFLWQVWNNYMMFAGKFFSFKLLIRTFFSPWRRYKWNYPKGFDPGEFFSTFISNSVSRILGAMMRTVLIIAGALFQAGVAVIGLVIFSGWLLIPFLVIIGIIFALAI